MSLAVKISCLLLVSAHFFVFAASDEKKDDLDTSQNIKECSENKSELVPKSFFMKCLYKCTFLNDTLENSSNSSSFFHMVYNFAKTVSCVIYKEMWHKTVCEQARSQCQKIKDDELCQQVHRAGMCLQDILKKNNVTMHN